MDPSATSGAYIREWLRGSNLKQADLVRLLGWSKAKANAVWHGEQRYNEDLLNQVASLVHARPWELLLRPEDAHRLRSIETTLRDVANSSPVTGEPAEPLVAPTEIPPAAHPLRRAR